MLTKFPGLATIRPS